MIKVATIAGSDASGGAGLEADLKTFEEYGVYGMTAVTLIATMNPDENWSHAVFPIAENVLRAQLTTIFKGVGLNALKTGMLGTEYAVELSREFISEYAISHYVLDPVMVCKGAGEALNPELNDAVEKKLLPLCEIITPNLFEAGQLAGMGTLKSISQIEEAADIIYKKGAKNVFIKGGAKLSALESLTHALDFFYDGKKIEHIEGPLINTAWTHGAGCTTAAAITAGLAKGLSVRDSVHLAKKFITNSLQASFSLNQWVGPGNPCAWRKEVGFFN